MRSNEQKTVKGKYEVVIWHEQEEGKPAHWRGYFEHLIYGEDAGGGLWFEGKELVDYDGVYELPADVIAGIRELRFVVPKEFE